MEETRRRVSKLPLENLTGNPSEPLCDVIALSIGIFMRLMLSSIQVREAQGTLGFLRPQPSVQPQLPSERLNISINRRFENPLESGLYSCKSQMLTLQRKKIS